MQEEKNFQHRGASDSMRVEPITFQPYPTPNRWRKGKLFAHSLRFVELLTVIMTCYFLLEQTETMIAQTRENSFTNKLAVAAFLRDHYQTINKIIAEQEKARDAFGLKIEQVLGYMLISDYDTIYQMRKESMIDDSKWKILDPFIRQTMKDDKLKIRDLWSTPGNRGRSPDFKDYVDACVYYSDPYDQKRPATSPEIIGMTQVYTGSKDLRDVQLKVCPELVFR